MLRQYEFTCYDYYISIVIESDMDYRTTEFGDYKYVVTEGKDYGAVIVAKFDRDGILLNIEPADEDINSIDDFINNLVGWPT